MVALDLFQQGDVYLDYRFEGMKFRFDKASGKVFVRMDGEAEVEIDQSDEHFREAVSAGKVITREQYLEGEGGGS
jgi:chaperonin GroEL (HSP60 family)